MATSLPTAAQRPPPTTGAAMDRAVAPRPAWHRRGLWLGAAALITCSALVALLPHGPQLQTAASAQLAPVRLGTFRDELALRARAEPLHSVQLDAADSGLVEAVFVHDGDRVVAGGALYRLRNLEQEQLWMQRSAEVAQQMANVSAQRSAQATSLAQHRHDLTQLQATQRQATADHQRQAQLAAVGFISPAALEQAERQQTLATQLLQQAEEDQRVDAAIHAQSLAELDRAVAGLQHGLQLLARSHERLEQRAAIAGQLSGFALQVGASVRAGDHLGRIDDTAGGVQLVADVDEYYLPRLSAGLAATSARGGLSLAQTLPQVQSGKVKVLLHWAGDAAPAGLRPGQAVDILLALAEPTTALLLPDGPGVQTQLYVRDGRELRRRTVRLGRRAAGVVEVLAGVAAGDDVLISQPPSDAERLALP